MALRFPTRAELTGSQPHASGLEGAWPEFMYHDGVLNELFGRVISEFAEFQFYAWDDERKEVVGVGNAIPTAWDGDVASLPEGGVDAVVQARFAEEPPATWRRPDGTHLDPWLRTHERVGAPIVKVAPESMRVLGTVAEWEEWAGMTFPETGSYVVPGALVPIEVDRERDQGLYVEPNVWMVHSLP
jgi:hypothetical protein